MQTRRTNRTVQISSVVVAIGLFFMERTLAHCDTMDGPVVVSAKMALEAKDVRPVLKWVSKEAEAELTAAFNKTLAVRAQGTEARELADQFFFETLVRVHRAGEGAAYTGLKPAGAELSPPVEEADKALHDGSATRLVELLTKEAAAGISRRFAKVQEKRAGAEQSVEAGRSFVAAYVEYVHYVEGLHKAIGGASGHGSHAHGNLDAAASDETTVEHSVLNAGSTAAAPDQLTGRGPAAEGAEN